MSRYQNLHRRPYDDYTYMPPGIPGMPEGNTGMPDMDAPEMPPKSMMMQDRMAGMPLAMAYVPWQQWDKTYDMEMGLKRGTIFPDLDKPFLGRGMV